jgi:AcrR family transcriptional regulator
MEILEGACHVFNRHGFSSTSFRAVAAELRMSPGHLHYHFKTKQALLDAVFNQLVVATEAMFADGVDPSMLPAAWFALQRKYLFFFRELPALLVAYPTLRRRYRAISRKRVAQFATMFAMLSQAGVVVPEPKPRFFESFAVLLWHQCNSILSFLPADDTAVAQAEHMLHTLLWPLLTELGQKLLLAGRP